MNWVVISDELSALGWRLAGARQLIADGESVHQRLREVERDADVVFVTADLAQRLPDSVLKAALSKEKPLMVLIAGLPNGVEPPDLEQEVKHVLGVGV